MFNDLPHQLLDIVWLFKLECGFLVLGHILFEGVFLLILQFHQLLLSFLTFCKNISCCRWITGAKSVTCLKLWLFLLIKSVIQFIRVSLQFQLLFIYFDVLFEMIIHMELLLFELNLWVKLRFIFVWAAQVWMPRFGVVFK